MRIIFLFLLLGVVARGQEKEKIDNINYKFSYILTFQPDSSSVESIRTEKMLLFVGDKSSKFMSEGLYAIDSVSNSLSNSDIKSLNTGQIFSSIPRTRIKEVIYKGYPSSMISVVDIVGMSHFIYKEDKNLFKWQLLEESKTINGFKCLKASLQFAGRNYIAWYTKDIPISEGPYKFNGLPGLIVNISDSRDHYNYRLTKVEESKSTLFFDKKNFITTTKPELLKYKVEYFKNFIRSAESSGLTLKFNNASDKKALNKKISKRNNNPIELEY